MAITDTEVRTLVTHKPLADGVPDHRSLEAIYRRHSEELTRFAVGLVGAADGPDLVTTVIARTIQKNLDWALIESPRAYLYKAIVRESMSVHRKLAVRGRAFRRVSGPTQSGGDDHSQAVVNVAIVRRALLKLPTQQRAVCVLTYWEDLPPDEVARLLEISLGAVKKHLARARARLRKELGGV